MRHVSLAEPGESEVVHARSEVAGAEVSRHAGSKAGRGGLRQVKSALMLIELANGSLRD